MKKIISVFLMIVCSYAFSQIPVTDATANANLGLQLSQSAKQLTQLQNTYKVMKEASDKFKQVNGYVQQMGQLQNIINQQQSAVNNANLILRKARQKQMRVPDIQNLLSQIQGSIRTVQAVMQNGMFKMTDAERINVMENELKKSKSASASIRAKLIKMSY
ncbi:hypothetical protein [Chryseobacterium sp. SL1]|uniref:hypothetical protein n=1 Tax=Chryseobacterium sp. SL1 TaxID=2995159 RepID=UPI0022729B0A|nr:hypothetical protein [Chryseobacterium sp. SL1]MCY1659313.1 hypothetical protein [Chryseobacterium sp. SL1]